MNGNEFGGPGGTGSCTPPAFAGRVDSSSKGHGPLREGLCLGIRLETALGISRGTHGPGICGDGFPLSEVVGRANGHIKTENMIDLLFITQRNICGE
jgi:hypothetical protein